MEKVGGWEHLDLGCAREESALARPAEGELETKAARRLWLPCRLEHVALVGRFRQKKDEWCRSDDKNARF